MKIYLLALALLCETMISKSQTISSLVAAGTGIKWYAATTGGTALPASAPLVNGTVYYASQTINGVESSVRLAVTATLVTQATPATAVHSPSQTQVVWNWNAASGAAGYKWNTTNSYAGATDLGNVLTKTETGLTCNTAYNRYVWAYNASGCVSSAVTLSQTTSSCVTSPYVTTSATSGIGGITATLNGNVTATGGATVTARGFKYSTTDGFNPALSGTDLSESGSFGTGSYSLGTSSLSSTTTYYAVAYATNATGTSYGAQVSFTTTLYTVWTFTDAGATSYTGPTQTEVNTAYSGGSLQGGVTVSAGIQYWTVPATGTYRIEAYGAQGGSIGGYSGGYGARMRGDFNLTAGTVLHIIAGQTGIGAGCGSGGGGGSFVIQSPYNNAGSILVIAGGGGGATSYTSGATNGYGGLTGTSGGTSSVIGGADASGCYGPAGGGTGGYGGTQGCAAGGGGFFGSGTDGGHQAAGGIAFIYGCAGGASTNAPQPHGGFGGGGAGSPSNGYGGGGGGYSGGGGGAWNNTSAGNGGGGGSYNAGTSQSNAGGYNTGNGYVVITHL